MRRLSLILINLVLIPTTMHAQFRVPQDFAAIQAAIEAAGSGDTIFVSSGIYSENIMVPKPLVILGIDGASNTILQDPSPTLGQGTPETMVVSINAAGPGVIRGFTIRGNYDYGAGIQVNQSGWRIEQCHLLRHSFAVNSYAADTEIFDNVFSDNSGIAIGAGGSSKLIRNTVFGEYSNGFHSDGVYARNRTLVANNLIVNCAEGINCGDISDSVVIRNNVISTIGVIATQPQLGIRISSNSDPATIENNIIAFCGRFGILVSFRNSNVLDEYTIAFNDIFMNGQNYVNSPDLTGIQGNMKLDPLFCDNDSLFYLASDSPCIDAGIPSMFDGDGTGADLGFFGGPHADRPVYAPASFDLLLPTDGLSIVVVDSPFVPKQPTPLPFEWSPSFDRDIGDSIQYRLILGRSSKPTGRNFSGSTYRVSDVVDTIDINTTTHVLDLTQYSSGTYYYTVEAIDRSGLFKRARSVRSFLYFRDAISPKEFSCWQNFPNPFNALTRIRYSVPATSHILITLYDVSGRNLATLEDAVKFPGFYEVTLNANRLSSGVYYYVFKAESYASVRGLVVIK